MENTSIAHVQRGWKFARLTASISVLLAVASLISPIAHASGTSVLLSENFDSAPGTPWVLGGNTSTVNAGYPTVATRNGDSRLRLTRAIANEGGYALYDQALPITSGLDITFQFEMWGGGSQAADGIAFILVDGATSNLQVGTLGGGLGYVGLTGTDGQGSLLGIGFDHWGGFRTALPSGGNAPNTCSTSFGYGLWTDAITVRGPSANNSQVITSTPPCSTYFGDYRQLASDPWTPVSNRTRTARIVVDPSTSTNPQVKVFLDDPNGHDVSGGNFTGTPGVLDSATPRLSFSQPAELQNATSFKFGFVAATGSRTNNQDILGISVMSREPLPPVQWLTSETLAGATVDSPYSQSLAGNNGLPGYSYSLVSGLLPDGLSLTGNMITGTPTSCVDSTFVLRVTDSQTPATTSDRTFRLRVNDTQQSCVYTSPTTTTVSTTPTTTTVSTTPSTTTVPTTTSTSSVTVQATGERLPKTGLNTALAWPAGVCMVVGMFFIRYRRIEKNW